MPYQPLKRCTEPGCSTRVKSGKCEAHKRAARRRVEKQRGTHTQRGYSSQWAKYRLIYLKEHPLCVKCESQGIYTPAKIVDHIIPIDGDSDVLFWWQDNHQSLCQGCHNRKIIQQDPITKAQRKAGMFREQEEKAAHRNDWIHEYNLNGRISDKSID
ncbi:HNH endonuclease [Arsenophonus nasoniae]|uniref:Putative HNH nuclease YajD n=1 Tax=Arsenophonus nasoniae TaxID=638 RepID=A0A4P7KQV2_9GAMM|nr:HNH endonuclease [Arsenophonus nasoniae]QBY42365.1 HNH endonuclease [Arsenophonus nasoniae]QBY42635.1 HNH endonuclease [Arsenophonus nasoniae]QBY43481.1 HNH endonuclease [Arsenophonus nasoniae]QBY43658.1 HNH endonuclease [Arsenophonus nasoniae]QBY44764.1 HNH endonuclease [Arsenophonus nasoniae]